MPTGYTAIIEDKKDVTFEDYIMGCARAFGACIDMRDEDFDKPIPKEFKPCKYHIENIEKAKKEISKLMKMSLEELSDEARKEYNKEVREYEKYDKKAKEVQERYSCILEEVKMWKPPTKDHVELKKFMIQQIELCTDKDPNYYQERIAELKLHDCHRWLETRVKKLSKEIEYHTEENEKEIERYKNRNEWVKQLRNSLKKVNINDK